MGSAFDGSNPVKTYPGPIGEMRETESTLQVLVMLLEVLEDAQNPPNPLYKGEKRASPVNGKL